MPTFDPRDPDFRSAVRESFEHLTLMTTIGATFTDSGTNPAGTGSPYT